MRGPWRTVALAGFGLTLAREGVARAADVAVPEVEIVDDAFARWRGTRWLLQTQIGTPWPVVLLSELTREVQVVAIDVRMVTRCEVSASLGPRIKEVVCGVEAASVVAAPWRPVPSSYAEVVDETARRLRAARVVLQVHANGRVLNVGLLGETQTNRRVNVLNENLRQLVARAFAGLDLQRPTSMPLGTVWSERQSQIFGLPSFRYVALGGVVGGANATALEDRSPVANPGRTANPTSPGPVDVPSPPRNFAPAGTVQSPIASLQAPTSVGHSTLVHEVRRQGADRLIVGEGTAFVDLGAEEPLGYAGSGQDVAVVDARLGYLTERRWVVDLAPTAGNPLSDGVAGWSAWQLGSLRWLPADAAPTLPSSGLAAWPGTMQPADASGLRPWPRLDEVP